MRHAILGLAVWTLLAVPLAVVVGRWLRVAGTTPATRRVQTGSGTAAAAALSPGWRRLVHTPAVAVMVALFVLPMTSAAANVDAGAQSRWFPVQLAAEDLQLRVAGTPAAQIDLHLRFAQRRVGDVDAVLAGAWPDLDLLAALTQRLRSHTEGISAIAEDLAMLPDAEVRSDLRQLSHRSAAVLARVPAADCFHAGVCLALGEVAMVSSALGRGDAPATAPATSVAGADGIGPLSAATAPRPAAGAAGSTAGSGWKDPAPPSPSGGTTNADRGPITDGGSTSSDDSSGAGTPDAGTPDAADPGPAGSPAPPAAADEVIDEEPVADQPGTDQPEAPVGDAPPSDEPSAGAPAPEAPTGGEPDADDEPGDAAGDDQGFGDGVPDPALPPMSDDAPPPGGDGQPPTEAEGESPDGSVPPNPPAVVAGDAAEEPADGEESAVDGGESAVDGEGAQADDEGDEAVGADDEADGEDGQGP